MQTKTTVFQYETGQTLEEVAQESCGNQWIYSETE